MIARRRRQVQHRAPRTAVTSPRRVGATGANADAVRVIYLQRDSAVVYCTDCSRECARWMQE